MTLPFLLFLLSLLLRRVAADGTIQWAEQSTIHVVNYQRGPKTSTSVTHLSICATIKLHTTDQLACKNIKMYPLDQLTTAPSGSSNPPPYYISFLSAHHHMTLSQQEHAFLMSLEQNDREKCSFHYASVWMYTNRNTIDYKNRCTFARFNEVNLDNGMANRTFPLVPLAVHANKIEIPSVHSLHIQSAANDGVTDKENTNTASSSSTTPLTAKPTKHAVFGVQHIQPEPMRRTWLSFIETNMKVAELLSVGVQTKELFAMVVDKMGNEMPEILTQLISSLIKIPLVTLVGQLLSALLPDALLPNSGATPNVPIVPGLDPIKPNPAPKCACSGGASFSLLERWRKQKGIDGDQWSSFVEEGAQCDCGTGEGGGESSSGESSSGESKSSIDASSFIEEHEQDTGQDTGQEAEHEKEREELYNLNDLYGPGDSGGANGGPIAKIEPKVRDAVMEGLLSNCMPQLQQDLAAKIIELFPTVKYSVYRGSVRGLSQSLTKSITNQLVNALLKKVFNVLTKYSTRELTTRLTIGLTHSLSSTISHALSRSPKEDYYCHYCEVHQLYCDLCKKGYIKEYELDYKISYYSTYYSTYYSQFYGTTISDYMAKQPN